MARFSALLASAGLLLAALPGLPQAAPAPPPAASAVVAPQLHDAHAGPGADQAHLRILPLAGQANFRDLGGYRTADGRYQVRWGEVFRSGSLARLTDADYAALARLRIGSVIDLRATAERQVEPTKWRAGPASSYAKDYASQYDTDLGRLLMGPGATPEAVKAAMAGFYRQMPEQYADQYAEIFRRLAGRDEALVFHCTAGKDRTGVAAAILLTVLGVPRSTVLADYELTDKAVDFTAMMRAAPADGAEDAYGFLRRLPPEVVSPLMRADPAYLEAALVAIEARYGSVEAYVRQRLGLTGDELAALRARLLEPAG